MEESPAETESLIARIQQLEHERDELRKDIEQLCMQQAGPSYLLFATRMHFQRTAGLEQEIENLKNKLAAYTRQNLNLKEELSEAYRVKSQLAELHTAEVSKNLEADKQLKFFQGCVASAFAERDNALMEAEKAKEVAEISSQELIDSNKRLEELKSNSMKTQDIVATLQTDLQKQERQIEIFKKVINKFYQIRQHNSISIEDDDASWDNKCACLLDDPADNWSFEVDREASTAQYINALQEELECLRSSHDNLQHKLRVGLEIENHLKRRISRLECYRAKSDKLILNGLSRLRECHAQQRLHVLELLDEGKCYVNSVMQVFKERLASISVCGEDVAKFNGTDEKFNANSSWLTTSAEENGSTLLNVGKEVDNSEALSQALQEKVSTLLLLQQEEERNFLERNVNAVLHKKLDELQRSLLQVTNEKVKALVELAKLKQEYQLLQEKINRGSMQEKHPSVQMEKRAVTLVKEGKLKHLLSSRYLKRWIGTTELDSTESSASLTSQGYFTVRRPAYSLDEARLKIENVTLKDTIGSIEHLIEVVRKLRLSLVKAKEEFASSPLDVSSKTLDEIIGKAKLVKTAVGSSLPLSWSGEGDIGQSGEGGPMNDEVGDCDDSSMEKMDSISAAGFEMSELIMLAAQAMKDNTGRREVRDGS